MTYFAQYTSGLTDQIILFGLIAAYSLVGVLIMIGCALLANYIFKLNMKKELLDDHNVAFGVMLAGLFIAISIIVAASIVG